MGNPNFLISAFLIVQIFYIEVNYMYEPLYIIKILIILCITHNRSTGHLDGKEFWLHK